MATSCVRVLLAGAQTGTNDRSEPGKYTLRANDVVSDIVRDVFSLGKDTVIETVVVSMTPEEVVAEATVA